tara:strand:- start:371 stop:544 length:174 start_codon:yes stop_codon:yes gene_type:complete
MPTTDKIRKVQQFDMLAFRLTLLHLYEVGEITIYDLLLELFNNGFRGQWLNPKFRRT